MVCMSRYFWLVNEIPISNHINRKPGTSQLKCIHIYCTKIYTCACIKIIICKNKLFNPQLKIEVILHILSTRVSMEVSNFLVSWFITYLGDLQPTFIGVIIQLLSTMDIPVRMFLPSIGKRHEDADSPTL